MPSRYVDLEDILVQLEERLAVAVEAGRLSAFRDQVEHAWYSGQEDAYQDAIAIVSALL